MDWIVVENKRTIKTLNRLPHNIQSAYSYWKHLITVNGIEKLREIKSFHFEKLKGKRQGQNSCRLSKGYRVIFEVHLVKIKVKVLEVNKHEY